MSVSDDSEQTIANAFTYPCPCGSGRTIIECCVSRRVATSPAGPSTGYSNQKCYARLLNDCSTKISAEHFVSKSVLELVFSEDKEIILSGASWMPQGESKRISIKNLRAKVLCDRHNEALSDLDEIGKKFFEFIRSDIVGNEFLMVNGDDLERWMLKVLCGYLASGGGPHNRGDWQPPEQWLQILFGSDTVPNGSGLYIVRGKDITTSNYQIGVFPAESDLPGVFNGLAFIIGGFHFLFFMGPPHRDIPLRIFKSGWQMRYRPECLLIITQSGQHEVHFGAPPRGGLVKIKVTPNSDGGLPI
jgi:hypothetical protein